VTAVITSVALAERIRKFLRNSRQNWISFPPRSTRDRSACQVHWRSKAIEHVIVGRRYD
jgi:hypothetical protein